jgi:hypothetical protein
MLYGRADYSEQAWSLAVGVSDQLRMESLLACFRCWFNDVKRATGGALARRITARARHTQRNLLAFSQSLLKNKSKPVKVAATKAPFFQEVSENQSYPMFTYLP